MVGDTDYGVYQTVASFANYLVLLEFGTGTVMTKNIVTAKAKPNSQEEINKNYSTIMLINFILSTVILAVSIVFYFSIGPIYSNSLTANQIAYGKNIFIFITVYLLSSFFSQAMNGLALGFEDYCVIPVVSIARYVIKTGLLIVALIFYQHSILVAMVDAALGVVAGVFMLVYCHKKFHVKFKFCNFSRDILRSSLPLALAIFLQTIVNQANNNVDKFVIGIKLNPESVTLYSVALYIYSMFSSLTSIPISMYAPQIIRMVNEKASDEEMMKALVAPSRFIVVIGGLCLFGFIACGRPFISIVYGEEYMEAWLIAIIIMTPMLINMSNGILINVLDATNKRMFRSLVLTLTTAANIVLTIFWIDWLGMVGAALATAISVIVGQITLMNIYYSKSLKINVLKMYWLTFKGILIYHLIGAAAGFAAGYFIKNSYLSFLAGGGAYVIVFFAGYLLFGMNKDEKDKLKGLIHRRSKPNDQNNQ